MRLCIPFLAISLAVCARAEIHDVLKSAEIDSMLSRATADAALNEKPHYSIWSVVRSGPAKPAETHPNLDEVIFVRRGSATVSLGTKQIQAAAGDIVKVPAGASHQINPGSSRFEALAVRIATVGPGVQARTGIRPAEHQMADLLKKADIDATLAKFDSNQPIYSGPNFTMNYVIYKGHSGPWEAHAGCVDIYFLKVGTAAAQLGGEIVNPKEEIAGEPRGDSVKGARSYTVGPGDLVLIPRSTTHHMDPGPNKLGYVLVKVWVD